MIESCKDASNERSPYWRSVLYLTHAILFREFTVVRCQNWEMDDK